jgi:Pvc16 N-terminal domain
MIQGILDLSLVTARLVGKLQDCVDNSPLWDANTQKMNIRVSGDPPDVLRDKHDKAQLGFYLFHVAADKFNRNSPVTGQTVPPIPAQPLSLELYYLLTASSSATNVSYVEEQQLMSIAMKCLYESPLIHARLPSDEPKEEFTLTMEVETADELGRLWQAIEKPARLSVVYKVSVVFLQPPSPPPGINPPPTSWTVTVNPATLPFAALGQVLGTYATVSYTGPDNMRHSFSLSPAAVAPGQRFVVYGAGLDAPSLSDHVYLLPSAGAEIDATEWVTAREPARFAMTVPTLGPPAAGIYQIRVGNDLVLTDPAAVRSNGTPFSIAPHVDPAPGPILPTPPPGTPYTLSGGGFITGQTEVLLGVTALTATSGVVGAGQFKVNDDAHLSFLPPVALSTGRYPVRVRVSQVEAPPAKWIDKPLI